MPRLRLSLTIPGAVSLSAYESGALAALLVAAQELGEDLLVVDSIATSSAGSISGLLGARSLLDGIDPVNLLASTWREDVEPSTTRQEEPILLSMALESPACHTCDEADPDWYILALTNTATPEEYLAYADAAMAAGAKAVNPPSGSRRLRGDAQRTDETGFLRLPGDGLFWYTVGGAVENEALDRAIDLAEQIQSHDERLFLVIDPDPAFPSRSPSETCRSAIEHPPAARPASSFFGGDHLPSIYEGLERLQGTPAAIVRSDGGRPHPEVQDPSDSSVQFRSCLSAAIGTAHEMERHRQTHIRSAAQRIVAEREADNSLDYAALLASLVDSTATPARRHVPVEVISPAVDPSVAVPAWQQIAGAYCGFFDAALRHGDFCLGYRNMGYWLEHRLSSYLPIDLSAALKKVECGYEDIRWHDDLPTPGGEPAFHVSHVDEQDLVLWGHACRIQAPSHLSHPDSAYPR